MQRIVLFDVWRRCFKRERLKKMIEDKKECPDAEVAAMLNFADAYKSKKDAKGQAKKKSTHAELTKIQIQAKGAWIYWADSIGMQGIIGCSVTFSHSFLKSTCFLDKLLL